ncbi:dimethyl sulfoxide reductase anchor subunit family protein [Tropicibacter naphthalenivorans]|uniref:DMSO reductase anchor subunit (DmsC) n=1 Tax=Tropicibacter naphthalenivorans TaxID=441103 RepID=A0A0P1GDK0_9RHOB|nr:DmsC/YnfH family molybdoenzyme membrane anchor subunit [Tropicibacter naphthalenivorans]CUH79373.1 DMSO reductase anchor subunit (DmsC) [Tropicibacter naphthalenivorans]SMC71736.1 DMSO reductase anchor subunit [Tropicibacter naphthalenivorans]
MYPAPSIIAFTTLSGLGFGLLFWLGVDGTPPTGWVALVFFALGLGLAGAGLLASAAHLGRPERALKAFTQWRSSWLSREAWAAAAAMTLMGVYGAALVLWQVDLRLLGWLGALACGGAVFTTAMIYTQLRTVPRWHHWSTPALFLLLALTGGALLSGRVSVAIPLLMLSGLVQGLVWWDGDRRFARSGTTMATATGLTGGDIRAFEPPHTGDNYLLREMVYVVGRKHAAKLRVIAITLMSALPTALLLLPFGHVWAALAVLSHIAGVATARWLFFAQAEHVVGLYYGKR